MGVPLFLEVARRPLSSAIICGCTAVWYYIQKHRLSYEDVGMSYDAVITNGQWWRIATSAVSHVSLLHLLLNMSAIWSLGVVEGDVTRLPMTLPSPPTANATLAAPSATWPGTAGIWLLARAEYLKDSVIMAVLSGLLSLAIYHALLQYLGVERYRRVTGVGYSCVVFGWMVIVSVQRPSTSLNVFGLFSLPISYAPFESLVLTSILVPNASFIGHLAGIIAGYLAAWGLFQGFTVYWQLVLYFWLGTGFLYSLKTTGPLPLNFLSIESLVDFEDMSVSTDAPDSVPLLRPIAPDENV